jgi:cytochrome c oxidase subunit 1
MHFVGIAGAPRRYYDYSEFPFLDAVMDLQPLISTFAIIGAVGQLFFLFNFFHSIFRGQVAVENPWGSNTLEWTTPVQHVHGNWPGALPEVHRWAYDYSNPAHELDFVPQTVAALPGEHIH